MKFGPVESDLIFIYIILFSKNIQISNCMKFRPVESDLISILRTLSKAASFITYFALFFIPNIYVGKLCFCSTVPLLL